ncbi:hypothetical protein [Phaeocystidibacter marisrubri]|uniref:G domain-containing protein n=1 Tax=Phaeocystidibacter marisrubri TaxID=1577780 RepID=A0A6L3ZJL6_9FLAO|nr:hypothetical protein [Phaeocystidibacter marisrubri]KAB2818081.1 hypothetical protein F8C82_06680 [Phaeocystidibacter marisrubri]GGH72044.1 hypothetical protein GCM10011318_15620 [Phaeocystidibacter marisrubri]
MKKIFILKGISNTGKTTKINQTVDWIITNYGCPNTVGYDPNNLEKDTFGVLTINNLTIGINSSGDDEYQVKKVDNLKTTTGELESPDIIICSCRTRGKGRRHLTSQYGRSNGWLHVFINVEEIDKSDPTRRQNRDARILDELQTWLTGLEKL